MKEQWVDIDDFPPYIVSNYGRVMNNHTETIKIPTPNQQGIPSVNLIRDRIQCRRSLAVLVAHAFLPPPERSAFDTPINLDGDRNNNRVDNLTWRPRWFAVRYHAQFKNPPAYGYTGPVELIDTQEMFPTVRECAMKYGLLEKEIVMAAHNRIPVFPDNFFFQLPL